MLFLKKLVEQLRCSSIANIYSWLAFMEPLSGSVLLNPLFQNYTTHIGKKKYYLFRRQEHRRCSINISKWSFDSNL